MDANGCQHRRLRRASALVCSWKSSAFQGTGPTWAPQHCGSHSPRSQLGPPSAYSSPVLSDPRLGPAIDCLAERDRPATTAKRYFCLPSARTQAVLNTVRKCSLRTTALPQCGRAPRICLLGTATCFCPGVFSRLVSNPVTLFSNAVTGCHFASF